MSDRPSALACPTCQRVLEDQVDQEIVEQLVTKLKELQNVNQQLRSQRDETQKRLAAEQRAFVDQNCNSKAKVAQLQQQAEQRAALSEHLQKKVDLLQKQLEEQISRRKQCERELGSQQQKENAALHNSTEQQQNMRDLRQKCEVRESVSQELKKRLSELENRLVASETRQSAIQAEKRKAQEDTAKTKAELQALQAKYAHQQRLLVKCEAQLKALTEALTEARKGPSDVNKVLLEQEQEICRLESVIKQLHAQLSEAQTTETVKIAAQRRLLEQKETEIANLTTQLVKATQCSQLDISSDLEKRLLYKEIKSLQDQLRERHQ